MNPAKNSTALRRIGLVSLMLLAVAVTLVAVYFTQSADLKKQLEADAVILFETPRQLTPVELLRHDSQPFVFDQFKGKWDLVNFGYTYCPDICPTNMADMNIAYKELQALGLSDQINFWMVTVDPERDTPQQLSLYVPFFNSDFVGLTGDPDQVAALATQLSANYFREGEGEGYTVAHTDNYAILNPRGEYVALMRPPHRPSHIVNTLSLLIEADQ